ncbi:MAG: zinc ribbon domain-containing protein, partial [Gaiellaceae bacterium]|nr:zinc ribbon domain-containing protein [Gaiellaceae bacterium]
MTAEGSRPCARCGASNRGGARYCALCGAPLDEEGREPPPDGGDGRRGAPRARLALVAVPAAIALIAAWLVLRADLRSAERELAEVVERVEEIDA